MHVPEEIRTDLLLWARRGREGERTPLRPWAAVPVSELLLDPTWARDLPMHHHMDASELLEQYMEAAESAECWVTVREIRSFFQIDESAGPAISGFLQRIHHGPFSSCRYRVARMEKFRDPAPPYRIIKKYLVQVRPDPRDHRSANADIRGRIGEHVKPSRVYHYSETSHDSRQ
jgi:hypothetical protein